MDGKLARDLSDLLGESSFFSDNCLIECAIGKIKQLRTDLDMERAQTRLVPPKSPDPDLDRIKREREVAHTALNQIHTAFGDPRCGPFNPAAIAERAVKVIREHREKQPEPPKKAVYEWQEWVLRRNGKRVGSFAKTGFCPDMYRWESSHATQSTISGQAKTVDLTKAAVEAVVRAHYGDEA